MTPARSTAAALSLLLCATLVPGAAPVAPDRSDRATLDAAVGSPEHTVAAASSHLAAAYSPLATADRVHLLARDHRQHRRTGPALAASDAAAPSAPAVTAIDGHGRYRPPVPTGAAAPTPAGPPAPDDEEVPPPTTGTAAAAPSPEPGAQAPEGAPDAPADDTQHDDDLRADQARLAELGYYGGAVDGLWGPVTSSAVRRFRTSASLEPGDDLDEETRAALHADDAPAAPPAPTPAPTPAACTDHGCRGQQLLAAAVLEPPPGWSVAVLPSRKGLLGMAFGGNRRVIEIYMRDGRSVQQMLPVLHHEVAHAWDFTRLTAADRTAWAAARGWPHLGSTAAWFDMRGRTSDHGIPAGDFAESVAWCVAPGHFASQLGPPPTAAQCDLALSMVGR